MLNNIIFINLFDITYNTIGNMLYIIYSYVIGNINNKIIYNMYYNIIYKACFNIIYKLVCIIMYNMLYNILNSIARFQLEFLCLPHYSFE